MTHSPSASLPPGTHLAHYRIEQRVGEGAMGTVYRAYDEGLDRVVAVKVLRRGVSEALSREDRFFREARAVARLSHPHLAHVYFVGSDGSYRFFAMEYIEGRSLQEVLDARGALDWREALDLLLQAARGLHAAHSAGIIHRDVKPSNLILGTDHTLKITDFGLSKSLDGDANISHEGQVLGTPTYMSPEQCRGRKVDARTDIYALGLTAYALLTGAPPFPGPTVGEVIHNQINTPPEPPRRHRPEIPSALERLVLRMCAKEVGHRPSTMADVVRQLEALRPAAIYPAPFATRAVALALDGIVLALSMPALMRLFLDVGQVDLEAHPALLAMVSAVFWLALQFGAECWRGQSLGKWLLQIAVTTPDGVLPMRRRLLVRYALRFPSLVVYALGAQFLSGELHWWVDALGIFALLLGTWWFWRTGGRTFSDDLTATRVSYVLPPAERTPRRRRRRGDALAAPAADPAATTQPDTPLS